MPTRMPHSVCLPAMRLIMLRPNRVSMKRSGVRKLRMIGRATGMARSRISAQTRPPIIEAMTDAQRARVASTRSDRGCQLMTVAWDDETKYVVQGRRESVSVNIGGGDDVNKTK